MFDVSIFEEMLVEIDELTFDPQIFTGDEELAGGPFFLKRR